MGYKGNEGNRVIVTEKQEVSVIGREVREAPFEEETMEIEMGLAMEERSQQRKQQVQVNGAGCREAKPGLNSFSASSGLCAFDPVIWLLGASVFLPIKWG